jgi:AcrR family transcriptional regulator
VSPTGARASAAGGRPRSPEADEAIVAAAVDLFAQHGYEGLSIEAVAERAGVARSTVYRRYPGKFELVLAALGSPAHEDEAPAPDTGSLAGDLVALAGQLRDRFRSEHLGRTIIALVAAAAIQPELSHAHQAFVAQRRQRGLALVERGVARGELPAGTDADLLVDLVVGTVFYRSFVSLGPLDDATLTELVDRALTASRTPS